MFLRVLTLLAATAAASITNCASPTARLQLTRLDLLPDPPSPGGEVFMAVEFENPGAPVTYGTAKRTVFLNSLPVVDETIALCPDATICPLTSGFNNRSATSTWPDVTGKIVSTIRWYDESAAELLCIKTSVSVSETAYRLRGSLTAHPRPHTPLGGIWTHVSAPVPAMDVSLLYPFPEFENSTQCALSQE
jgi:hypothetical protein